MSDIIKFSQDEIQAFVHAVKIGGLRKDARVNAFDILEMNDKEEILNKYDSLNKTQQREFRVASRNAIKKGEEENLYNISDFDKFIEE